MQIAVGNIDFDDLLKRLEEARIADDEIHNRDSSLAERAASRDVLIELRSEIARARAGAESLSIDDPSQVIPRSSGISTSRGF